MGEELGLALARDSHELPCRELRSAGVEGARRGRIIPRSDAEALMAAGVSRVYTPKDFEVSRIMGDIVDLVAEHYGVGAPTA